MATLGLKEMGKFFWEGREKDLSYWLSQFSKTKLSYLKNIKVHSLLDECLHNLQLTQTGGTFTNLFKLTSADNNCLVW